MNPTQHARLSIILISLVYFLPIITLLLIPYANFGESSLSPSLLILCFVLTLIILILPGFASFLYTRYVPETNWKIHLTTFTILFAGLLFLIGGGTYMNPVYLQSTLSVTVPFYMPVILLFMIPVWLYISYAKESQKSLKLFGVLAPVFYLIGVLMIFMLPDCPVGENPAYSYADAQLVLLFAELFSIVSGALLVYLGVTHPEVSEKKSYQKCESR